MGSGGVKIAPKIRKTTIANFRYSRKNAGVRIPIFVKNIDTELKRSQSVGRVDVTVFI